MKLSLLKKRKYLNLMSILSQSWKFLVVVLVFVSKSRKSSHWRCSIKIGVLTWKFAKFRWTFLCKSLFFNKVSLFPELLFFNFFYRILIKDCWKSWLNGLFGTDVYKTFRTCWLSLFARFRWWRSKFAIPHFEIMCFHSLPY